MKINQNKLQQKYLRNTHKGKKQKTRKPNKTRKTRKTYRLQPDEGQRKARGAIRIGRQPPVCIDIVKVVFVQEYQNNSRFKGGNISL